MDLDGHHEVCRRCLVIHQAPPTPARWQLPAKTAGSRPDWTAPPPRTLPMATQNEPPPKRVREIMWGGSARGNRSLARARQIAFSTYGQAGKRPTKKTKPGKACVRKSAQMEYHVACSWETPSKLCGQTAEGLKPCTSCFPR